MGGFNTLATWLLYWLLLYAMHYQLAYAISYVAGIALSYFLNLFFVFSARHSLRKAAAFPLVYVVNYLIGCAVVWGIVRGLQWDERIAPLIATCVTLPLTFILSKRVLSD